MPFRSKKQLRYFAAAEARGELPKGTFAQWKNHTPDIKTLPDKVKHAYYMGVEQALVDAGLKHAEEKQPEPTPAPQAGRETRLKLDHKPDDFYGVKRNFERAEVRKKEVGTHVPLKPK